MDSDDSRHGIPGAEWRRAPAPPPAPPTEPFVPRRLRRSREDRVFGGVCGGLAEYFGVDPVLLRIVAVALALSSGAGFLLYLVAWIAIPEESPGEVPASTVKDVRLQWSVVVPVALVLLGVGLLVTAVVDTHLLTGKSRP